MAAPLAVCTKEGHHAVTGFLLHHLCLYRVEQMIYDKDTLQFDKTTFMKVTTDNKTYTKTS